MPLTALIFPRSKYTFLPSPLVKRNHAEFVYVAAEDYFPSVSAPLDSVEL